MTKRIRATGSAQFNPCFNITGGCDTDKNFIVAAIFHSETGDLEAREFRQHHSDAIRAAEWFLANNGSEAISGLSRRISEALWWGMVRNEPYKYGSGVSPVDDGKVIQVGSLLVSAATGEVLQSVDLENKNE